ncbi:MAG: hypothetical protein Tsb0020_31750 [Haliangiales bacterium]
MAAMLGRNGIGMRVFQYHILLGRADPPRLARAARAGRLRLGLALGARAAILRA